MLMPLLASYAKYILNWLTSHKGDYIHHCAFSDVKQNNDQDVAIYCVHGTADQSSAFSFITENIKSDLPNGVKSIHQLSFDGRFQLNDISFFANQLKDKILADGQKKIVLWGHSRGAIVASYFTEYLAKDNGIQVEATINICGPFYGSIWAVFPFTYSASINQMRIESPFLDILRKKMRHSENTYYYFSGTRDILVPPSHAFIKEHENNLIELNEDHLSIMLSPQLVDHLKNILNHVLQPKPAASTEAKAFSDIR
jgi:pimeloyl-ACP methyl ester carboxylesterase